MNATILMISAAPVRNFESRDIAVPPMPPRHFQYISVPGPSLFPPATHLRHDHRTAHAVLLCKPGVTLALCIRPRIDAARINRNAGPLFLRCDQMRSSPDCPDRAAQSG